MSNSIWKTPDQKPEDGSEILFMIGENHCVGYYDEQYWLYVEPKEFYNTEYAPDEIDRWIYVDDLIAQADKAERLQKAVDFLSGHLRDILQLDEYGHIKLDEITKQQIKTAISDPVGIITQLEQESNNG